MRIGYSIVTSEIIEAVVADYGDCAKFQIVCPCCREAVFKGKRDHESAPTTHYFSHYMASDTEARACEMRVAALAKQYIAKPLIDSHGQTLKEFLAVFREAIVSAQDKMGIVSAGMLRRDIMKIMARSDMQLWERPLSKMFHLDDAAKGSKMTIPQMRDDCAGHIGLLAPFSEKSQFWLRRQASYYLDVITHLDTPQAAGNFTFMAAACYSVLYRAPDAYHFPKDERWHDMARSVAGHLMDGRSSKSIMHAAYKDLKEAENRGLADGRAAACADSDYLKRAFGFDIMPKTRAGLLASAGGSVFANACIVPRELVAEHKGRLEQDYDANERKMEKAAEDLMVLQISGRIYSIFMGLVAAVPYHELLVPEAVA